MTKAPRAYLAAPFFNPSQLAFVEEIEKLLDESGYTYFSPRLGENAQEMNARIAELKAWERRRASILPGSLADWEKMNPKPQPPDDALRNKVFFDNYDNIDKADILVAVIDDFDVGVMWEVGYAYKAHVPILTTTARDYGCNLMLAQSIVGHTKSLAALADALAIGNPRLASDARFEEHGAAIAEIQAKYKTSFALKEGPDEREQ